MERDEYLLLKCRQEIAKSIIDKIDTVSINDVGLIPAIVDYIQTGNIELFEEYHKFHFLTDAQSKETTLAESEKLMEIFKENQLKREKYLEEIREFGLKFCSWRDSVINELDENVESKECFDLKDLMNFAQEIKDSGKTVYNRAVYVKIGDDIKRVNSIVLSDKSKIIMDVEETPTLTCHPPLAPAPGYDEYVLFWGNDNPNLKYLEKREW